MDKQKQIEELTKELDYCETHDCIGESCAKCRAIWLVENGYRKIDKGSVVFGKEMWEDMQDSIIKEHAILTAQKVVARTQAVKEFAERLKESLNDMEYRAKTERKTLRIEEVYEQMNWMLHKVVQSKIDEIAKEFGVEL